MIGVRMTLRGVAAALTLAACSLAAHATDGYFQNGYGARSKALAGAGVANEQDSTATSLNPAHRIKIGMDQFEVTAGFKYRFGN